VLLPKGRVGVLDAGMVGRLDDQLREQVINMLLAAGDQDSERLTDVICQICNAPPDLDRAALSNDLEDVFNEYGTQAVGEFDIGGALTAITSLLHQHKAFMPSRLSMLIKCLIVLEGTAQGLNASFSLAQLLEPYRRQFVLEQMSPDHWLRLAARHRHEWERLAETAPRHLNTVLEQLQAGTLQIQHPSRARSVNRLAYGVCASAVLLASTLLWINRAPPTVHGTSVPGVAGGLFALLLIVRLLWVMRRDERT
jgi:ubiquinone biosynthesis protein